MKKFKYVIKDEVGIHARPVGALVNATKKFESKILIGKDGKNG
jgi:phosphocarrier protein HPr